MDSAVKAADKIATGDPTWLLAFLLVVILMLNGIAIRTIFQVLFRAPNAAIQDKGGMMHEIKFALLEFVSNVNTQIVKQSDSIRELEHNVKQIKDDMPTVCKSGR